MINAMGGCYPYMNAGFGGGYDGCGAATAYAYGANARKVSIANTINSKIAEKVQYLNAAKNMDGITQDQKDAIDKQIKTLEEIQQQAMQALQSAQVGEAVQIQMSLLNSLTAVDQLISKIQSDIQEAKAKEQEEAQKAQESASGEGAEGSDGAAGSDGSGDASVTVDDKKVDPKTGRPEELGEAPKKADIDSICAKIYASVNCSGTDHNVLDPTVKDEIDATNIIEIVKNWEEGYGKHHDGDDKEASHSERNQGFFARIFDDVGDDWQRENVPHLLKALTDRAEVLGIYDEVSTYASKVNKELGASKFLGIGGQDDHVLADNLMKIYNKIAEKEAELKEKAGKKVDADKAEADKKTEEAKKEEEKKDQETVNLFIGDMREIWEDEKLEKSDKVEYKDGKFQIRIQGDVYEGKTFKELVKAIEDAGLDPKKYLSKQGLDTKA